MTDAKIINEILRHTRGIPTNREGKYIFDITDVDLSFSAVLESETKKSLKKKSLKAQKHVEYFNNIKELISNLNLATLSSYINNPNKLILIDITSTTVYIEISNVLRPDKEPDDIIEYISNLLSTVVENNKFIYVYNPSLIDRILSAFS